ncbi:flavodoxin family protein [Romboutsia maritimum]|uniref:Flavodoxin family protein n=1 Tax=Romboutsia maritimum TaxID=2020948 RepID=A0A371IWW4_9FIRM|nr:flavodoxin family protein [Romboutsia maritimum]RDY24969.1 flavodoxin family protein [Romboutsia maritimum]
MNIDNPNILIINGSPRKNKNCYSIAKVISSKLKESNISNKIFNIYDMDIEYCTACGFCDKTGYCRIKDDMTPMYEMFDNCEGCIVISPVHFDCISAKLKTVVDRTQAIYASKYVLNQSSIDRNKKRIGMYIAVGGSKPYGSQFMGGQIVMDFFFKSINNKLLYKLHLHSTDDLSYDNNSEFKNIFNKSVEEYKNEIISILV